MSSLFSSFFLLLKEYYLSFPNDHRVDKKYLLNDEIKLHHLPPELSYVV